MADSSRERPPGWKPMEDMIARQIEYGKLLKKIENQRNAGNTLMEDESKVDEIFASKVTHGEVRVTGNAMTAADFIRDEFDIDFPCTIQQAGMRAYEALERMHTELDIIESARLEVDIDDEDPSKLTLDVDITEKNRMTASAGATQDVNSLSQVNAVFNVGIRNVFQHGERLDIQCDTGLSTKNEPSLSAISHSSAVYSVMFQKPRMFQTRSALHARAFKQSVDRSQCSSYREDSIGTTITAVSPDQQHSLAHNLHFRSLIPIGRNSPMADPMASSTAVSASVGDQIMPNLKSSLQYRFLNDERQFEAALPVGGSIASLDAELAGFGGDVDFVRAFGRYQFHHKFPDANCILNVGAQGGAIFPWKKHLSFWSNNPASCSQHTQIIDRFIPPGGLLLRGFEAGKTGPRDGHDFVHADYILNSGASLTFPVFPWLSAHFFASGMLSGLWQEGTPTLNGLKETARGSVGASLVFPFPVGRLEVGYAHPIQARIRDGFSRNIFWAFDVSFF